MSGHGNDENACNEALATVTDVVTDIVTGAVIPAPIRRNVFKAFGQLCTALVDIPIADLECIAEEKRAESQARRKIIAATGEQIAAQLNVVPEYAHAAMRKYGERILREQINLDKISEVAAKQLQHDAPQIENAPDADKEVETISEDWLNVFAKEACQKSTKEMQVMFGRILAGEIQRPSSFSIKTVKLLGELDREAASIFRRFCSMCISMCIDNVIIDVRVPSLGGNAGANTLKAYTLSYSKLNILCEYGLINPEYNSSASYILKLPNSDQCRAIPFIYQNRIWNLIPDQERPSDKEFRVQGVSMSQSGKELLPIVEIEEVGEYNIALQEYFAKNKLRMVEIVQQSQE